MRNAFALSIAAVTLLTGFGPKAASAQTGYSHVSAPFAQRITANEMTRHAAQIQKIGLHAVPPGGSDNVIIASNTPAKIGKKSSASDMTILAAGQPHAITDQKGRFYDLALPITDRDGHDIGGGLLVLEVPFADASNQDEALKIGIAIRDELKAEISSKDALYQ